MGCGEKLRVSGEEWYAASNTTIITRDLPAREGPKATWRKDPPCNSQLPLSNPPPSLSIGSPITKPTAKSRGPQQAPETANQDVRRSDAKTRPGVTHKRLHRRRVPGRKRHQSRFATSLCMPQIGGHKALHHSNADQKAPRTCSTNRIPPTPSCGLKAAELPRRRRWD